MKFQVKISQRAKQDTHDIQTWIKGRSLTGAAAWLAALEKSISHLSEFADANATAPEADDLGIDLKQQLFKTRRGNSYRLLFVIRAETVLILAVRGMGQDLLHDGHIESSD